MERRELERELEVLGGTESNAAPPDVAHGGHGSGANVVVNSARSIPESLLPDEGSPPVEEPIPAREAEPPRGPLESALRRFVDANWRVSGRINEWAAAMGRADGSQQFPLHLQRVLRPGLRVIDLGSGRHPSISAAEKRRLGLHVIGVDVSREELDAAPPASWDEMVCDSAETFVRPGEADLVISRALVEHVPNPVSMFRSVHASLKPGGETLHFIPNRNALFAVLNRMLPHEAKRKLLYTLYPMSRNHLGFRAYYRRCSPAAIRTLLGGIGFRDVTVTPYFSSNYFVALFPAHAAMVSWQVAMQQLGAEELCESFVVHARK